MSEKVMMTAREISRFAGVRIGSIYSAMKLGKLKATRKRGHWYICTLDYLEYVRRKYDRKYSTLNGEMVYDDQKGELSLKDAAKILRVSYGHVYNLIQTYRIPYVRKAYAYVVTREDVEKYRKDRNFFVLGGKTVEE